MNKKMNKNMNMNMNKKNTPSKAVKNYVRKEVLEALAYCDSNLFGNEEWLRAYYYRDIEVSGVSMNALKRAEEYAYNVYDKSAEKFENADDTPDYDEVVAIVDEVMKNE